MPLPTFNVESEGTDILPVEALPVSRGQGMLAGVKEGAASSLMASGITRIKGALGDQTFVPYKDAAQEMQLNGYDAGVLPKDGLSRGFLDALKDQQSALKRNAEIADDAGVRHTDGWTPSARGMSEFAGGSVADSPFFMLGGGAMGVGLRAAGVAAEGGLAGIGIRAGEGATLAGGYDAARKEAGTAPGDKDLGMYDFARDMALGGVLGSVGASRGKGVTTNDVAALERTAQYAKARGLNPDEVVSSAGAIGVHQIEPATARALGITGDLKDPAVNKAASQALLDQLNKQFKNDGEAVSIAYNAGPKWAEKWLKAGRDDSVLPKETRGYVQRYRELSGVHPDSARVANAAADLMQDKVPAERRPGFMARARMEREAAAADADASTRFDWQTPEADQQLASMAEAPKEQSPEMEQLSKSALEAKQDAEHATLMANPESDLEAFKTHMADATEPAKAQAQLEQATVAALKCAVVKGFG